MSNKNVKLCVYRGDDYSAPSEARQDGALYTLLENINFELLNNKELMNQFNDIANKTEHCINNGLSEIVLVWIDSRNHVCGYMFDLIK